MRAAYLEVLRNLTFKTIKLETRMSNRQVAILRWSQIKGNVIRTSRHRDCEVSREVIDALSLLPHSDSVDLVFFGNPLPQSDLERIGELQNNQIRSKRHFVVWRTAKSHKHVDKSAMVC